jgi:glycosyltransferase involved in cell wall biosynthesis
MPNAEALPLAIMGRILKKRIIALYLCDVDLGPRLTSQIVNAVLNRSIDMQLMLSDKIVAIADYIEHRLAYQKFGDKIVPLLPPIDTPLADQAFVKKLAAGKDRKIWIGFAGRLAREKGIEHLIHALKIIGDNRYELVIAGPQMTVGEHAYSDAIMELLERSRIRYHRFVSLTDSQLASVYEMLDILVLPSINTTEAFGMVQAEAMLHGTPVIATNLPGVRMPVQLTGCGTIVPPANPKAIAGAIKSIINAQFNRSEVIKKARKKFNPDPVYESIESLLLSNK